MDPENTVSIHPYFQVHEGKMEEFKLLLPKFIEKTESEPDCLYYDFTVNGSIVFCREAYVGGKGALAHLQNVDELLKEALTMAELIRLEIHGSTIELDVLREPLNDLNPDWFAFDSGLEK
ncbi:MAG: hypothetical protein P1U89_01050 [Verrucomicrobiales bacterium]|nr:hypothetical protein [Verrucomicrobiales bacterium]